MGSLFRCADGESKIAAADMLITDCRRAANAAGALRAQENHSLIVNNKRYKCAALLCPEELLIARCKAVKRRNAMPGDMQRRNNGGTFEGGAWSAMASEGRDFNVSITS